MKAEIQHIKTHRVQQKSFQEESSWQYRLTSNKENLNLTSHLKELQEKQKSLKQYTLIT